jgi:hypothetical protein
MTTRSPQLIVREAMPWRQRLLLIALALTLLVGAFGAFEYGRSRAGYDFWQSLAERREIDNHVSKLEAQVRELSAKLAATETEKMSLARERAEVARSIGDLQAQVSRQAQQLAFYKGIVTQGANTEDVKIQRVRVEKGEGPGRFRLKIALVRPVQTENLVSGAVAVQVDGRQNGQALRLELRQMTATQSPNLPYSFRYVENLDTELKLPVDFQPERVTVEVKSAKKGADPLVQTQVWQVEAT